MPTLAEFQKLSNDKVEIGVFDEILTANELNPWLQFKTFSGNSMKYNRENTLGAAAPHTVGDVWTDTEPTYTQKTASLTTLGIQHPLDRFISQTMGDIQGQQAVLVNKMAKSLGRLIADLIITGEPESTSTEFEGLDSLIRSETRMMAMDDGVIDGPGTVETELTIDRLDGAIDSVEEGLPHILIMNKTMRRKLTTISRVSGSGVHLGAVEMFGRQVSTYRDIPIVINDFITNGEQYNDSGTWPSSTATTIFGIKLGEEAQGYTIIHNGPVLNPDIQDIGIKEAKNENLFRMAVYMQSVTFSSKMVIALGGIDSAA